jgi:TPR repeat protein
LFARIENIEQAVMWWARAAGQGDPEAQYNLALMYGKGQGVEKNLTLAFSWLVKAAAQGVPSAQARLGLMYATGEGVALDPVEAHKWFVIASRGGDSAAEKNRLRSEASLAADVIREAQRRADEWTPAQAQPAPERGRS